jgi:phosphate-selective porin
MFDAAKVREPIRQTIPGPPDAMGNPTTVTVTDPAKSSAASALQDFYITGISHYVDVSIGQFKIPVSWEGYNSSGKLMFPERAYVSNQFGDKRDLGIRLEKKWKQFGYSAGVFNGGGPNAFDTNVQKDLGLRLEYYPIPGLTVAGVTYDSVMQRRRAGTKDRWEIDVRYEKDAVLLQAEAIMAQDVLKDLADPNPERGMYILAGYTLKDASFPMHGELQPVVRFGAYDPNTNNDAMKLDPDKTPSDKDSLMHIDVGVNYYLVKHEMKLQAAYQAMLYQADMKPANNQLIVAAQVMY